MWVQVFEIRSKLDDTVVGRGMYGLLVILKVERLTRFVNKGKGD